MHFEGILAMQQFSRKYADFCSITREYQDPYARSFKRKNGPLLKITYLIDRLIFLTIIVIGSSHF